MMADELGFKDAAEELIHDFLTLAQTLDDYYENCNKVKVVGSAAAVAGGAIFVVAGITASVSTFGLAAPIAAGAATLATTGSVATGGASLVRFVMEKVNLKRTDEKWKRFKMKYYNVEEIQSKEEDDTLISDAMQMNALEEDDLSLKGKAGFQSKEEDDTLISDAMQMNALEEDDLSLKGKAGFQSKEEDDTLISDAMQMNALEEDDLSLKGKAGFQSEEEGDTLRSNTMQMNALEEDALKGNAFTQAITSFLTFTEVFFDEQKLKMFIREQLSSKGESLLGIQKTDTVFEAMKQIANNNGICLEEFCKLGQAVREALCHLNMTDKENLVDFTIEECINKIAERIAAQCSTLAPYKIMKFLNFVYAKMPDKQKKQLFGHLTSAASAVATGSLYGAPKLVQAGVQGTAAVVASGALAKSQGFLAGWVGKGANMASQGKSLLPASWLQSGANTYRASAALAGSVAQRTAGMAQSATSFLPPSAVRAGSAACSVTKSVASGAWVKGGQACTSLKPLASGVVQRGGALARAGQGMLPSSVVSGGSSVYAASSSLVSGAWSRGWGAASRAKTLATGLMGGGKEASRVSAVTSVGRPMLALNVLLLPLSVYDLITVSIELRQKKKSRAGDFLRELADVLCKLVYDENQT